MSNKKCLKHGESSLGPWKGRVRIPQSNDHHIDKVEAEKYEAAWRDFKDEFDALAKVSKFNLCAVYKKIDIFKKIMLINYETFQIELNDPFKAKLMRLHNEAATLQIIFGIKDIEEKCRNEAPEIFEGKTHMNCVILVARDPKGDVIWSI